MIQNLPQGLKEIGKRSRHRFMIMRLQNYQQKAREKLSKNSIYPDQHFDIGSNEKNQLMQIPKSSTFSSL